jgi:hypothetical protein
LLTSTSVKPMSIHVAVSGTMLTTVRAAWAIRMSCGRSSPAPISRMSPFGGLSRRLHYASLEEFVLGYVSGSALTGIVDGVDESARAALLADVGAKLAPAIDDQGLRFPIETNIAVART